MTEEGFHRLLDGLSEGWARRDYVGMMDAFAPDVRYADPLRYSFSDRKSLQAFFENDEGCEQRTVWHTVIFDETRQIGAVEYTYEGTHRYHGVAIVRIVNDQITHWREYQHVDQGPYAPRPAVSGA